MNIRTRLRDFILTFDDWFFSVVSYELGSGSGSESESETGAVKCLLRYIPDECGTRISNRNGRRYRKLDFNEAYEFLRQHRPLYVRDVHHVPECDIKEVLRPEAWLPAVAETDDRVARIYELLRSRSRSHIPADRIGITGSFLCGLNTPHSDIDIVIYGLENFNRAREAVASAKEEGIIRDIDDDTWRRIYRKRNPELSYEEFIMHEKRKNNRGIIGDTYFDILYSRDWAELALLDPKDYEPGRRMGYLQIKAEVKDASFSFDNPAIYRIEHPEIDKVLSFTHTYVGQAQEGEWIEARGVVEKTAHENRLVVGTTREAKGEWIRCISTRTLRGI